MEARQEEARQEEDQHMAEPQHPHMATLIRAMTAILGYAAVNWLEGRDDLTVGGMLLKDMRIGFCLRGGKELWYSDWILKDYGPTVTVQCGSGWWATGYQPCAPNLHFDLSAWTFYERSGSKASLFLSKTYWISLSNML